MQFQNIILNISSPNTPAPTPSFNSHNYHLHFFLKKNKKEPMKSFLTYPIGCKSCSLKLDHFLFFFALLISVSQNCFNLNYIKYK